MMKRAWKNRCEDSHSLSSRNAAFVLKEQGFRADDYPGGIQEWSDAGLPIEGTEADVREAFAEAMPTPAK